MTKSLPTRDVRTRFTNVPRNGIVFDDPSLTDQSFTDECDINNVILRFAGTGELPPRRNEAIGEYLDVSEVGDLHQALNTARAGRELFNALPLHIREAIGNDPMRLLDAIEAHQASSRINTEPDVTAPVTPGAPPAPPLP